MDLALALKYQTVEQLRETMTEYEFGRWQIYHARKRLPERRMELYLARIAQMLSDGKLTLDKFLMFERPIEVEEDDDKPMTAEQADLAMSAMLGGVKVIDMTKRIESRGAISR